MRVVPWLLAITLVAACGGGDSSTTPPPPPGPPPAPPPPPPANTVTATIATGGGVIAWDRPASSLNGARVTLSAGAFTSSTAWTLEERTTTGWPQRTNVTLAPVGLRISATATGHARSALRITLPVTVPAGHRPFVLMRNAASGAVEVLPTISHENGMVTAATTHLDGTMFDAVRQGGAGVRASVMMGRAGDLLQPSAYDAQVAVATIPQAALDGDIDTGFRPGADDFPFAAFATAGSFPQDISFGSVLSQMAYYASIKTTRGALHTQYQLAAGVYESNRVGLRAASYVENLGADEYLAAAIAAIRSVAPAGMADRIFHDLLVANMIVTRLPQVMFAEAGEIIRPLVVYRTAGGTMYYSDPNRPGDATPSVAFTNNTFGGVTVSVAASGGTTVADQVSAAAAGMWIRMGAVAAEVGTILQDGPWPVTGPMFHATTIHARGGFVEDTIIYLTDTTRIWVTCAACQRQTPSTIGVGAVQPVKLFAPSGGGWALSASSLGSGIAFVNQTSHTDSRVALALFEPINNGTGLLWLDWKWMRVKKWVIAIPAGVTAETGVQQTFTVTTNGPVLPAHRYAWTFGTAATVFSPGPSVNATVQQQGTVPLTVEIRRQSDDRVLARAQGVVQVGEASTWRLVTFQQTALTNTFPANHLPLAPTWENARTSNELRDSILARPNGALLRLLAANAARPQGFKRPDDTSIFRAEVPLNAPAMYLTYPRGAGELAEAVAALGAGTSPTLPAVNHPFAFANTYTRVGGPPVTYMGRAANWVRAMHGSITDCGVPGGGAPYSPARSFMELSATSTSTGLTGTITIVTQQAAIELQAQPTVCNWAPMAEVRRTFAFTAVPE